MKDTNKTKVQFLVNTFLIDDEQENSIVAEILEYKYRSRKRY